MRDKYKYCAHKDDLLMCVGSAMFPDVHAIPGKQAYPPVVSNLGDISAPEKALICLANAMPAGETMDAWLNTRVTLLRNSGNDKMKELLKNINQRRRAQLPDLRFMGFSCGLGYVHPSNGDTVVSSYIGGMITVRNGAFPMKTGDRVMFYLDFEAGFFQKDGKRMDLETTGNYKKVDLSFSPSEERMDSSSGDRSKAQWRSNGWLGAEGKATQPMPAANVDGNNNQHGGKQNVAFVKPYIETSVLYPRDALRIFGIALGNARPWDQCDVKVSTQCS